MKALAVECRLWAFYYIDVAQHIKYLIMIDYSPIWCLSMTNINDEDLLIKITLQKHHCVIFKMGKCLSPDNMTWYNIPGIRCYTEFKAICIIVKIKIKKLTVAFFISMLVRGILYLVNLRYPLSTSPYPNLRLMSPTSTPRNEDECQMVRIKTVKKLK